MLVLLSWELVQIQPRLALKTVHGGWEMSCGLRLCLELRGVSIGIRLDTPPERVVHCCMLHVRSLSDFCNSVALRSNLISLCVATVFERSAMFTR